MDSSQFVDRNGREDIKIIDKCVRNKFNWMWLEEKDANGDFLSDYIRKLKDPGFAWCLMCKAELNYGSSRKKHVSTLPVSLILHEI